MAQPNMEKKNEKPIDVYFAEESEKLRLGMFKAFSDADLPLFVRRLVVTQTANEIVAAINQEIERQAQDSQSKKDQPEKEQR